MAGLTNTQAAYRFYNDRFMAAMEQRAQNLWTDGYRVTPLEEFQTAALATKFLVYKEDADPEAPIDESSYVVDPLGETCTCPFFANQAAEPLNESGETVACKHLLGLRRLVDEEVAYWNMKAEFTADHRREIGYVRVSKALTETLKRVGK